MWQLVLLCFSLYSQNLTIIPGKYITSLLEENTTINTLFLSPEISI